MTNKGLHRHQNLAAESLGTGLNANGIETHLAGLESTSQDPPWVRQSGTARVSEKDVKELTARPQLLEWLGGSTRDRKPAVVGQATDKLAIREDFELRPSVYSLAERCSSGNCGKPRRAGVKAGRICGVLIESAVSALYRCLLLRNSDEALRRLTFNQCHRT